jgi:hypothetical protein
MNKAQTASSRRAKDADVVVGNSLATIGVATAATLGVIGLLVGFDIIDTDRPFENGLLWLASGLIAALCANAFRREHHVIDVDEQRLRGDMMYTEGRPLSGGAERSTSSSRMYDTERGSQPGRGTTDDMQRGASRLDAEARDTGDDIQRGVRGERNPPPPPNR